MSFFNGRVPKYRKHSSGNARVTINDRVHYLGKYGTQASKREYDRLIAEFVASGRSASFGVDHESAYTVAMLIRSELATPSPLCNH